MRNWKCEYCNSANFPEKLDCRKCGAPQPDDAPRLWGNYDYPAVDVCNASFTGRLYSTASKLALAF